MPCTDPLADPAHDAGDDAIEAAAFRKLVAHLRARTDAQNIDLMILAGFCRNCLADWYREAAQKAGKDMSRSEARRRIYGMPHEEWQALHQTTATAEQLARYELAMKLHPKT
ncbi:MAG: DUF1244 domain-containing protein [Xanthomonadales bacterium]|nr:DUF1244 domain-containing protein [Xanthomonadales bacterium]